MRLHSLCLGAAWVGVMLAMAMGFGPIAPAHAQGSGATGVDAGQIERRIQQMRPRVPTTPAPAPEFQAPPAAPQVEGEFSLVLAGVLIEGVTAFPVAEFGPLYAEFLAQSIGRAELDEIAVRITRTYTEAGFYLSRAVVPVQTIESGILRVRVIEGFLTGIRFEGADKQDDLLDSYAALIAEERPARLSTVERSLLLINGLPGVQVIDVQVARLDDGGAYELVVAIDYNMAEGTANLDNRGTPEVGRLQGWLSGAVNSVAGLGERLQVDFATVPDDPKELVYGQVIYEQPLGRGGTILGASVSASMIDAGATLASEDTDSRSLRIVTNGRYPLALSRDRAVYLRAALEYLDVKEDRFNLSTVDDRLRVVRLQADYSGLDNWGGANYVALEASQGFDILNASDSSDGTLSRSDGEGVFTKLKLDLVRVQEIYGPVNLRLAAQGQTAFASLLSSEEFALGGSQFGRAYDFGEISGEDGVAGSFELSYHRESESTVLTDYEVYGFYDLGAVWNDNTGSNKSRNSLVSVGGGMRLDLLHGIQASIEAAKPLTRVVDSTGDKDWRVFFSLGMQF